MYLENGRLTSQLSGLFWCVFALIGSAPPPRAAWSLLARLLSGIRFYFFGLWAPDILLWSSQKVYRVLPGLTQQPSWDVRTYRTHFAKVRGPRWTQKRWVHIRNSRFSNYKDYQHGGPKFWKLPFARLLMKPQPTEDCTGPALRRTQLAVAL